MLAKKRQVRSIKKFSDHIIYNLLFLLLQLLKIDVIIIYIKLEEVAVVLYRCDGCLYSGRFPKPGHFTDGRPGVEKPRQGQSKGGSEGK